MPEKRKTPPVLRLRLQGPGIRNGRIPVPDLIEICKHAQTAVNRQAQAMEWQRTRSAGPIMSKVRNKCTLELMRVGPATLDFGLEEPQPHLPYPDFEKHAADVISELTDTMEYFEKGGNGAREFDWGVLDSIHKLGAVFDGKRVSKIDWTMPARGRRKRKSATYNSDVRDTLERRMQSLPVVELETFHIETTTPVEAIQLGTPDFEPGKSLEGLIRDQGVKPLKTIRDLEGGMPDDDSVDELIAEIYATRS